MTQEVSNDPRDVIFDVSNLSADLGRQTGRSAASVVIFALLKLFIAVGATAFMARLVPPAEQGLVALAIPFVLIAVGLSEFGLAQAITQMPHVTHRLASTLFWVNVALGTTLTVIIASAGPFAARFLGQPQVTVIFWILSPYIFLSVLNTQFMALLRRRMQIRLLETCVFYATLIASCLALGVAWLGYGVAALITQLLAQQALTFVMLVSVTGWRPSGPWGLELSRAKQALSFGGFLAAERILNDATRAVQITIIGRLFGETGAGLYYRTETFALMPQRRLVSPLSAAFIPSLSRLQDDAPAFRTMLAQQITRGNMLLMPIGAFFCTCPDVVVAVLLGPAWGDAVPMLAWLGVLALTGLALSCFAWALVAAGRARELFYFRLCSTALIVLAIALTYQSGLIALIRAYVIAFAVLSLPVLCLFVVRYTALKAKDVLQIMGQTAAFAATLLLAGFSIRIVLDTHMAVEGITVGITTIAVVAIRLLRDPTLLMDIKTTFRPKAGSREQPSV